MLTQLLIVIFNFKYHFTFFYFSFVAIANCSSLFIKSIPRTLLCDKWRHNDLTVAVNSTEMVDQTRASFQGAILRCRRKKEIEPKDRAQVDEGNQRGSTESPGIIYAVRTSRPRREERPFVFAAAK